MNLEKHPFFTEWRDPESGAVSYILTKHAAPVQQNFYFTNRSLSANCKYLWFYAAFPPSPHRMLGVVSLDADNPDIKVFPQAAFTDTSPMISPDGETAFFATGTSIYKIDTQGETTLIGSVPGDYINNRFVYSISTHLSISADSKWFFLDGRIGNISFWALMDTKTGEFKLLHEFDYYHDHGQFSPTDPNLILVPRDWRYDDISGKYIFMENRLWITDVKQTFYRPLNPNFWEGKDGNTAHEWWSGDNMVCYIWYSEGVFEINPYTLEQTHAWKHPLCHAHSNADRTLFCADQSPYDWKNRPVELLFYDRVKDREHHIVTAMPQPSLPRGLYHIDPHPQFSMDGHYIDYMTTVLGQIDIAITPVEQFT